MKKKEVYIFWNITTQEWDIVNAKNKEDYLNNYSKTANKSYLVENFETLKDAENYSKNRNYEIKRKTPITYSIDEDKTMQIYLGDYAHTSYEDVKNKKQAEQILAEDFGL